MYYMATLDIEEVVIKNSKISLTANELKQLENKIPVVIFATKTDTITLTCDGKTTGLQHIRDLHDKHNETQHKPRKYVRSGKYSAEKIQDAKDKAQANRERRLKGKDAKDIARESKEKLKGLESIVN